MISLPERITREYLLQFHSEEAYITRYTGIAPCKNSVKSPFRQDKHPSCRFFRASSGAILLCDFSRPEYTCDFVKAAMFRYSCSYRDALRLIAEDYGLIAKSAIRPKAIEQPLFDERKFEFQKTTFIRITVGEWLPSHLEFWNRFGITKEILKKFRVYRCAKVFLNGNTIYVGDGNVFGYFYKNSHTESGEYIEYWRIYFPGRKKMKFLSSWNKSMVQGYNQLPDTGKVLVITKSLKDVMAMYAMGITAIAPNGEGFFIPDEMVENLKTRFKFIVVMYDNDKAGLVGMAKIRRKYPDFVYIWIDKKYGCKDFADVREKYGESGTRKLVDEMRMHVRNLFKKIHAKKNYYNVAKRMLGGNNESGLSDNWGEEGP